MKENDLDAAKVIGDQTISGEHSLDRSKSLRLPSEDPFGLQPNSMLGLKLVASAPADISNVRPPVEPERTDPVPSRAFLLRLATTTEEAANTCSIHLEKSIRQECLLKARSGLNVCECELKLPGQRNFVEKVARLLAGKVEELGFQRVEWWNGREWRPGQGRYYALYDANKDSYYARLRAEWDVSMGIEVLQSIEDGATQEKAAKRPSSSLVEAMKSTVSAQVEALQSFLASHAVACEQAALEGEEAAKCEHRFRGELGKFGVIVPEMISAPTPPTSPLLAAADATPAIDATLVTAATRATAATAESVEAAATGPFASSAGAAATATAATATAAAVSDDDAALVVPPEEEDEPIDETWCVRRSSREQTPSLNDEDELEVIPRHSTESVFYV